MRRRRFGTLVSLMSIVLLEALPSTSFSEEGKWTKKANMPFARYVIATSVVDGKIYVIGGTTGNNSLSTVEKYDPARNTWTKNLEIMPTGRWALSTSVIDEKIYAMGGMVGNNPTATVEEYDPTTDTWTKKADMPTLRRFFSTSVVKGKIYTIGGRAAVGDAAGGQPKFSTVEEYDPTTDTWTKKADMPTPRSWLSTSVVSGKIYAIGGHNGVGQWRPLSTVEEYDPVTDTWTKRTDMPTERFSLSASVVNGKIYVVGGSQKNEVGLSTVEMYDPATDRWSKRADMPTARWYFATSAVNGKIYAIGGRLSFVPPPQITANVEEYDTGEPQSVEAKGKLATTWGKLKVGS